MSVSRKLNRRELFRTAGRTVWLGAVTALTAVLAQRGRRPLAGERCINRGLCRGCSVFEECGLPQALSAKAVSREVSHE